MQICSYNCEQSQNDTQVLEIISKDKVNEFTTQNVIDNANVLYTA